MFRSSQHTFLKGRSVETVLYENIDIIEISFLFKKYTLATFIGIEGAFKNVESTAITKRLQALEVKDSMFR